MSAGIFAYSKSQQLSGFLYHTVGMSISDREEGRKSAHVLEMDGAKGHRRRKEEKMKKDRLKK